MVALGKQILTTFQKSLLEDIAVNKIQAVTTRTRARDYFDLMLCLNRLNWNSEEITQAYRSKFEIKLPPESLATAYTNVQSASDLPIFMGKVNWEEVEVFFLSRASEMKNQIIK